MRDQCRLVCMSYLLAMVILLVNVPILHSQYTTASSLSYSIVYDPLDNSGVMWVTGLYNIGDCSYIVIPTQVIENNGGNYTFIDYNVSGLVVLGSEFNESTGVFTAFACGRGSIELHLTVEGVFEEMGFSVYSVVVNTTLLTGYTSQVQVYLSLPVSYNITVDTYYGFTSISVNQESSTITLVGFGIARLTLQGELEEVVTPTPTSTPTPAPTPTQTFTPTSTPTSTPTLTPSTATPTQSVITTSTRATTIATPTETIPGTSTPQTTSSPTTQLTYTQTTPASKTTITASSLEQSTTITMETTMTSFPGETTTSTMPSTQESRGYAAIYIVIGVLIALIVVAIFATTRRKKS